MTLMHALLRTQPVPVKQGPSGRRGAKAISGAGCSGLAEACGVPQEVACLLPSLFAIQAASAGASISRPGPRSELRLPS